MARLSLPPAEKMRLSSLAQLARGGMGSVELARAEGGRFDGQLFAIKRLHDNIATDPQFVDMFLDEAWMTAALRSPNVVKVAAWGNDERGMFLAVELVQGVSLLRLLKEARQNKESFAERAVAFIGSEICAGLAAAHGLRSSDGALLGLVHRDLTASNILVSFEGEVKIIDFGIAKAEQRISHTQTGQLKGKPGYMAPEQSRGRTVDARADIFSFGVLMFEILAGRRPWIAKSTFDVMMEAANQPPPDLATLRIGCDPLFVRIVNKCLEKAPEDRFASATEIQELLDEWRRENGLGPEDRESLAQFTQRNCARQIEWFNKALRGEFAQGSPLTFQELQEQIDDARKKEEKRKAPPQPAAVRASPTQPSSDAPRTAADLLPEPDDNAKTHVYKSAPSGPSSSGSAPLSTPLPSLSSAQDPSSAGEPSSTPASFNKSAVDLAPIAVVTPASTERATEDMPATGPAPEPQSAPMSTTAKPRGRGRAGAIAIMLLLPLVGVLAVWQFRSRLLEVSAPSTAPTSRVSALMPSSSIDLESTRSEPESSFAATAAAQPAVDAGTDVPDAGK